MVKKYIYHRDGNFPGGDKILKTGTERVDLISCKFGKSGRTYGFPR